MPCCRHIHDIVYYSPYIEYVVTEFFGNITGTSVDEFLRFYRATFPDATITPKLHLLEDHVVPQMRRWHWSLGLHGEQGAESIHNVFNNLERTYCAIRNPLKRMKCMLKEHQLQVSPSTAQLEPTVVKRKKL